MIRTFRVLICILILLGASLYAFSAPNLKWSVPVSMSPSPADVGETVTFNARLWIRFEAVTNLRVIGGVDGVNIYDNTLVIETKMKIPGRFPSEVSPCMTFKFG